MYLQNNMHRLLNSFKWGFTSDRIAEALSKYNVKGRRLSEEDRKVLNEGVAFIVMVLNGRKQITAGVYQSNALESLMIYNKSLSIVLDMPDLPAEINSSKIEEIFVDIRNNLVKMIDGAQVSSKEVDRIKKFFNMLREATLDDSTSIMNGFYESRGSGKWESIPET
jgi:hypothetical protein